MPSVMPIAARRSGGTDACVIVAGCEISVSTPPRLSASACSRTAFSSRRARSERPSSNASIPPNPRIWRFASSCCGCVGSPGSRRAAPSGARLRNSASARPLALCCCIRSASVLVPRSTSHESNGPRIAPSAFWMNCSHSMSSSRTAMTTPPTLSLWPLRYFVVLCVDQIGAELDRPLNVGAGERVVDDEPGVVAMREIGGGAQVRDAHHRVGRRLDEQHPRRRRDRALDLVELSTCRRR